MADETGDIEYQCDTCLTMIPLSGSTNVTVSCPDCGRDYHVANCVGPAEFELYDMDGELAGYAGK